MKPSLAIGVVSQKIQILLVFLVLLFTAELASAQSLSLVKFKDGTSIEGRVTKLIPDSILVLDVDRTEVTFHYDSIQSITRSRSSRRVGNGPVVHIQAITWPRYMETSLKDTGFFVNGNFMLNFFGLGMDASVGYQFNQYVGLGGYGGLTMQADRSIKSVPMGLEFRGALKEGSRSPFYFARAGYSHVTSPFFSNVQGGLNAGIGFGMLYKRSEHRAFQTAIAFTRTDLSYDRTQTSWPGTETHEIHEELRMHRLEFKFGILF